MSIPGLKDIISSLATQAIPYVEDRMIYIFKDKDGVRVKYSDCELLESTVCSYRVMYEGYVIYPDRIEVMDELVKAECVSKAGPTQWWGNNGSAIYWK
jgi:hypothetical protein